MFLKYMVLGCILDFPASGYEILRILFRDFAEQKPEVNKGQLYALIRKMEEEGLIVRDIIYQDKAPNLKIINITPQGEKEFYNWLNSETGELEQVRYDFFNKYSFLYKVDHFNKLPSSEILNKIDKQIEQMEEKLQNFLSARDLMSKRNVDIFRIRILEYGIKNQELKIDWLKSLKRDVPNQ